MKKHIAKVCGSALLLLLAVFVLIGCSDQENNDTSGADTGNTVNPDSTVTSTSSAAGSEDGISTGTDSQAGSSSEEPTPVNIAAATCGEDWVDYEIWPPAAESVATATLEMVEGVSDTTIRFGQSAAFSGAARALGEGMKWGIRAAFHERNNAGGVGGRFLELVSMDDCYEPDPAHYNTERLIHDKAVFALIGATGTPTSEVAAPAARKNRVPYVGPFTGAELLREDFMDNVINFRASYFQETATMVKRLSEDLGYDRIAVFFQNDSYGREGYRGVVDALVGINKQPVSTAYYTRNTEIVKGAVLDLQASNPQAVIIIGTYKPTVSLIRWSRKIGFNPVFMSVSFVGADVLVEEFRNNSMSTGDSESAINPGVSEGAGVYITQVVPFPRGNLQVGDNVSTTDGSLGDDSTYAEAVSAYSTALAAYNKEFNTNLRPSFVSFEGYLVGRLAVMGLEVCEDDDNLTRKCFTDSLLGTDSFLIDGLELTFNDDKTNSDLSFDNQGSDKVFITVINDNGDLEPVTVLSKPSSGWSDRPVSNDESVSAP